MSKPIEVAVIGGGCASITAAFELTKPEHEGKYSVTVYQQGWRIGGKGASGRGADDRIEEHGLHIWMGFYDNAFRVMRECYEELGRDPAEHRIATCDDAFFEGSQVGVTERMTDEEWNVWTTCFPSTKGRPGDPLTDNSPFSVASYLSHAVKLVATLLKAAAQEPGGSDDEKEEERPRLRDAAGLLGQFRRLLGYAQLGTLAGLVEALQALESVLGWLGRNPKRGGAEGSLLADLVHKLSAGIRGFAERRFAKDAERRRLWEVIDLMLTIVRGSIREGLMTHPDGFDAIDHYDFREWLEKHGASPATTDCAFVRAVAYDLIFAYEDGDTDRPSTSAAQALRGGMRMFFGYRGALFWRMTSGMGDIVFTPFYEVLRKRGVKFEFFHRLENVKLADPATLEPGERPYVEALEFDVQAKVRGGAEYEPLVDVRGLPCWPAEPDWKQLVGGRRMKEAGVDFESFWDKEKKSRKTLRVTKDFDFVVLGLGLGAVPYVCSELVERDARWRRMVERVKTVNTQAFQLWMHPTMEELGYTGPQEVTVSGFVEPFDTWAAMPHLLSEESWPEDRKPRSLAYFCNVFPTPPGALDREDTSYPLKRLAEARENAVDFLNRDVHRLWSDAASPKGGFRWQVLVEGPGGGSAAKKRSGSARLDSQFWTANVNPTDRYVLSLPGTAKDRISPLDNTYDNLTVAGDWTACGHVAGCVEAAVMSGRLAAHSISQQPPLEDIVAYDHP